MPASQAVKSNLAADSIMVDPHLGCSGWPCHGSSSIQATTRRPQVKRGLYAPLSTTRKQAVDILFGWVNKRKGSCQSLEDPPQQDEVHPTKQKSGLKNVEPSALEGIQNTLLWTRVSQA
ncbi:hypothetical protein Nepgr_030136 [Nepenthes gracilis]|uniref:Uncharacterized protein n=1 Tax=Nepenthes gracilis TaxID=150966 RepID=A0AAD3TDY5_NEPGR|nr:hypothetical protein Nepgr_030136 [Nepenthes gracilis]